MCFRAVESRCLKWQTRTPDSPEHQAEKHLEFSSCGTESGINVQWDIQAVDDLPYPLTWDAAKVRSDVTDCEFEMAFFER